MIHLKIRTSCFDSTYQRFDIFDINESAMTQLFPFKNKKECEVILNMII